jgi:mannosyltransferase OCH1-like enzyme
MFIVFFLICFFVRAEEESRHQLNTLLGGHAYERVFFVGDPAQLIVENNVEITVDRPRKMKASDALRILYHGSWHNETFYLPEGTHDIKMRWSINIDGSRSVPVAYLRRIVEGNFYYTARQDSDKNILYVKVNRTPLTRFLILEPFDVGHEEATSSIPVPDYVQFFQSVMPIDLQAVQQSYNQLLERCSAMPYDAPFQIPLIMHTIWITDSQNPKLPNDRCFTMHQRTIDVCAYGWEHIFWVHDKNDNPALSASPTNCPETDKKVDVRELRELFRDERLAALKPFYEDALRAKNYGRASDIGRIGALYIFGGVYRDTDFEFLQDPKKLNQACRFYAGFEDPKHTHINNAMIASAPAHSILTKMMARIANPPLLPNEMKNPVHATLFETGPFALTRAIFNGSTENSGLLPHHVFYAYAPTERGYVDATRLGVHGHFKEWVEK